MRFIKSTGMSIGVLLALVMALMSTAAYNVNYNVYDGLLTDNGLVTGTTPVNNANVIGFVCADPQCRTVSGRLWGGTTLNTGSSNNIMLTYPTALQSTYGYLLWWYKEGYVTYWSTANWYGVGTAQESYSRYLAKNDVCSAHIDDFTVINDAKPNIPLVIGVDASLDATTYAAFSCKTDKYLPLELNDLFSADTRVTLEIFDGDDKKIFSQQKDLSLFCSTSKRVEFTWTPEAAGSYRAVARTDVTDSSCLASLPQQASKDFSVLGHEPKKQCYTLINNLVISNPYPKVGDVFDMSFTRISNYAEDNYALSPVTTDVTINVVRDSTGAVVYSTTDGLSANPNIVDPVKASHTLDTSGFSAGQYTIIVTGRTNDLKCSGLETLGETERLGFYLAEKPTEPKNTPPVISGLPDRSTQEDSGSHERWTDLFQYASDAESTDDQLSFWILSQSNPGLINCYVDEYRYVSCSAPAKEMHGTSTIVVQVSDGEFTDADSFDVIVTAVDDAPVISDIPDVTFPENSCYSLDLDSYVADPDNTDAELTWSVSGNNNVDITINPTSHVAKFCAGSWYGSEDAVFKVTDPDGLYDSDNVKVTVTKVHVNQAPVISDIPDVTFPENSCYSLDLDSYVADPDNTDAELTWSVSGNNNVDITINPTSHVAKFCAGSWYGSEDAVFKVTDPDGLYDSDNVKVTVTKVHVNQAPVISDIPDVTFPENSCYSIDLDNYVADPDNTDAELTWSVSGNHDVDITINPSSHVAKFCAGSWYGSEDAVFKVTDPDGLYDSDNVKVTVTKVHVNQAPKITGLPDVEFEEGSCYSLDLDDYVTDPDNSKSELTWKALYNNYVDITINPDTHVARFCAENFYGKDYVSFEVIDPEGASDKDDIVVTVDKSENDQPPVISDIPDVTFPEDTCYSIMLDNYVSDPDNADSELVWGVSGNFNINVNIDSLTHVAELCPNMDWNGGETLKFTVTDPGMMSDSDDVKAVVTPVNDAPVITGLPDVTFDEYSCYSLDLDNYVADPDNSYSELTWEALYNNFVTITIDPFTHVAKFCADDFHGNDYVSFRVTDPDGASDKADIVVTVNKVTLNKPPVLDIPDQTIEENSGLHDNLIDIWAYSSDETPDSGLSFSLDSQSRQDIVSCSLDSNRYLDCTTQQGMFGASEITVTVGDGEFTTSDTFSIDVTEVIPGDIVVQVIYPNGGEVLKGTADIRWDAVTTNICLGNMSISLDYSDDSGSTWNLIADNVANDGTFEWDTKGLKDLSTYLVRVTATDCLTSGYDTSDDTFTINNHPAVHYEEQRPNYALYIKSIVFENPGGDMPAPGEELQILITIENIGDEKLKGLKMMAMSDDLAEVAYSGPFDLGRNDQVTKRLILDVPYWAQRDEYPLRITIQNNDVKRVVYRFIEVS